MNPYRLPDDGVYRTINFSGGRSSAYMTYQILKAHNFKLPEKAIIVFCNTGKEHEATLDFVRDCGERWGVYIWWLEFRGRDKEECGPGEFARDVVEVDYKSASRNGEPFAQLIEKSRYLPSPYRRLCTSELKVHSVDRFVRRHLGWPTGYHNILGIRHDEPDRWQRMLSGSRATELPMVHAEVDKDVVMGFWAEQDFDLGVISAWGNCDLCFMKGYQKLQTLIALEPDRAKWWVDQEEQATKTFGKANNRNEADVGFHARWRYKDLLPTVQVDDTEQLDYEESLIDCVMCGD